MTYRELQSALKQLRNEGKIPASFKLNQKKAILEEKLGDLVEAGLAVVTFVFNSSHERSNGRIAKAYRNEDGSVTISARLSIGASGFSFKEAFVHFLQTAKKQLNDCYPSLSFDAAW